MANVRHASAAKTLPDLGRQRGASHGDILAPISESVSTAEPSHTMHSPDQSYPIGLNPYRQMLGWTAVLTVTPWCLSNRAQCPTTTLF
jgi:hypothetical protein